jgi:hypothetical protein
MSETELAIKVAQLLGWRYDKRGFATYDYWRWSHPKIKDARRWPDVPDYVFDLNACRDMEKALGNKSSVAGLARWSRYNDALASLCKGSVFACHATAKQKCKAFVKVMEAKCLTTN